MREDPDEYRWIQQNRGNAAEANRVSQFYARVARLVDEIYGPIVVPNDVHNLFK